MPHGPAVFDGRLADSWHGESGKVQGELLVQTQQTFLFQCEDHARRNRLREGGEPRLRAVVDVARLIPEQLPFPLGQQHGDVPVQVAELAIEQSLPRREVVVTALGRTARHSVQEGDGENQGESHGTVGSGSAS